MCLSQAASLLLHPLLPWCLSAYVHMPNQKRLSLTLWAGSGLRRAVSSSQGLRGIQAVPSQQQKFPHQAASSSSPCLCSCHCAGDPRQVGCPQCPCTQDCCCWAGWILDSFFLFFKILFYFFPCLFMGSCGFFLPLGIFTSRQPCLVVLVPISAESSSFLWGCLHLYSVIKWAHLHADITFRAVR